MRIEAMTELGGAGAVYAAGGVLAGRVALAEVRRGGPDGALVDALDPESRRGVEDALFDRAGLEADPCERPVRHAEPLPAVTPGCCHVHHCGAFYQVTVGADGVARFEAFAEQRGGAGRTWAYRLKATRGGWGAEDAAPNKGKGFDTIPARSIGLKALKWAHGLA